MSYPATKPTTPFGIPTGGLDFVSPLGKMPPNFSPWMNNVICESQFLKQRPGCIRYCRPGGAADEYIIGMGTYRRSGTEKMFAYVQDGSAAKNTIFEITTSTPSSSKVTASMTGDEAYPLNYAGVLGFTLESATDAEGWYYNGSWNDMDFTYSGTTIDARVGTYYKGRMYLFAGIYMYYSDTVGAVTGTCSREDLTEIFSGDPDVQWVAPFSSPGERTENTFLAFGNANGEVVVYGGDYPGSATWEVIARYKISSPVGNNTILEYRNDVWVLTMTGVVSLRDLFQKGSRAAEDLTVSWRIDPYWVKLLSGLNNYGAIPNISAAFWTEENKIYILVNNYIAQDGTTTANSKALLVYNCATEAWSLSELKNCATTNTVHSLTYFQNNLYFAADEVVMQFNTDGTKDETFNDSGTFSTYTLDAHSAYSNFNTSNKYKDVHGWEPVMYLGTVTSFKMQTSVDMGRKASTLQGYSPIADSYQIPFLSTGESGTYAQWRLQAVTSASGDKRAIELYSMGVAVS